MGTKRKQHSAQFKAEVAMAALAGTKTLAELASEYGVHPTMISTWKQELAKNAKSLFEQGKKKTADPQAVIDNLHRKIGQLQVERVTAEPKLHVFSRTEPVFSSVSVFVVQTFVDHITANAQTGHHCGSRAPKVMSSPFATRQHERIGRRSAIHQALVRWPLTIGKLLAKGFDTNRTGAFRIGEKPWHGLAVGLERSEFSKSKVAKVNGMWPLILCVGQMPSASHHVDI